MQRLRTKDSLDDSGSWDLHDPDLAWRAYTLLESIEWRALPVAGGLLEQPEALMDDIATISWREKQIRDRLDSPVPSQVVHSEGQVRDRTRKPNA